MMNYHYKLIADSPDRDGNLMIRVQIHRAQVVGETRPRRVADYYVTQRRHRAPFRFRRERVRTFVVRAHMEAYRIRQDLERRLIAQEKMERFVGENWEDPF